MTIYRRPDPIPIPRPVESINAVGGRGQSESLQARAAREMFVRIFLGHFTREGVLPNEAALCEELRVSRTVVREAIKTLEAKNVLEARRKRGTQILSREDWSPFDRDLLRWRLDAGDRDLLQDIDDMLRKMSIVAFAEYYVDPLSLAALSEVQDQLRLANFDQAALAYFRLVESTINNPLEAAIVRVLFDVRAKSIGVSSFAVDPYTLSLDRSPELLVELCERFLNQTKSRIKKFGASNTV
ncbi:MAG: FadR family transcriptional regulator [Roseitalea sp.]|jgi:DNA-binding FadR family transcriptional regulator|nr:FadR family transcriptional regulator [Roseitalea sp.]MBO6721116.1 FadR family transcriptional regulator [Roseitalea sp.]MBO6744174.1 FadR family transcriptional regulator [Roseitalea sp.]